MAIKNKLKSFTLREALSICNIDNVHTLFFDKWEESLGSSLPVKYKSDKARKGAMAVSRNKLQGTIDTLLGKPVKKSTMPIWILKEKDPVDEIEYTSVCLLNPKYISPRKNLQPWGGKNPPKGYYNCNLNKHNKKFAFGFGDWERYTNAKIIDDIGLSLDEIVTEILWELTFNGFTEEEHNKLLNMLKERMKEIMKEKK